MDYWKPHAAATKTYHLTPPLRATVWTTRESVVEQEKEQMADFLYDEAQLLSTLRELVDHIRNPQEDELPCWLDPRLCGVWDATAEKTVCEYLEAEGKLMTIMEGSLQASSCARLREICWGILSNLASNKMQGFSENFYLSEIEKSTEGPEIDNALRFIRATMHYKLIPLSYWAPLKDMLVWCVENALIDKVVESSAIILKALNKNEPEFYIIKPCADRAVELSKSEEKQKQCAAQACLKAVEMGLLSPKPNLDEAPMVAYKMLECLRGSSATQKFAVDCLEILDEVFGISHTKWLLFDWHREQIASNDDISPEQKKMFGVDPNASEW